jgi:hypothetical protein
MLKGGRKITAKKQIGRFIVTVWPSIYISRLGKVDIRICEPNTWGGREEDGKLYTTSMLLAAEDHTVLRSYKPVPDNIISSAVDFARTFDSQALVSS